MDRLEMIVHIFSILITFATQFTAVWPHVAVHSPVIPELVLPSELLITDFTFIWRLTSVHTTVSL